MEGRRNVQRGLVCVLLAQPICCSSSFRLFRMVNT